MAENVDLDQEAKEDLVKLVHDQDDFEIQKDVDKHLWSQLDEVKVSPNTDAMETNSKGPEEDHLPLEDRDMHSYENSDIQAHSLSTSRGSQEASKVDPSFLEDESFDCFMVTLSKGSKDTFGFRLKRSLSTRRGGYDFNS